MEADYSQRFRADQRGAGLFGTKLNNTWGVYVIR